MVEMVVRSFDDVIVRSHLMTGSFVSLNQSYLKNCKHGTTRRTNEPRHEKTCFLHMQKQRCRSAAQLHCMVTSQLISVVFATKIVQSLYFLNPNFQASCHLLWLCSLVCVGPGQKP